MKYLITKCIAFVCKHLSCTCRAGLCRICDTISTEKANEMDGLYQDLEHAQTRIIRAQRDVQAILNDRRTRRLEIEELREDHERLSAKYVDQNRREYRRRYYDAQKRLDDREQEYKATGVKLEKRQKELRVACDEKQYLKEMISSSKKKYAQDANRRGGSSSPRRSSHWRVPCQSRDHERAYLSAQEVERSYKRTSYRTEERRPGRTHYGSETGGSANAYHEIEERKPSYAQTPHSRPSMSRHGSSDYAREEGYRTEEWRSMHSYTDDRRRPTPGKRSQRKTCRQEDSKEERSRSTGPSMHGSDSKTYNGDRHYETEERRPPEFSSQSPRPSRGCSDSRNYTRENGYANAQPEPSNRHQKAYSRDESNDGCQQGQTRPGPASDRPSQHTVDGWRRYVDTCFANYAAIDKFPHLPVKKHDKVIWEKEVAALFRSMPGLNLKKERLRWHPDRFSACTPVKVQEYKRLAQEVFVVLDQMYSESK